MSLVALHRLVRARAHGCCEYCQLPESCSSIPFEIDHIIARKHNGLTDELNLALSCWYCNSAKGPCIGGRSQASGEFLRLYNPRQDIWSEHFRWNGGQLVGLTQIGLVTVQLLAINEPLLVELRSSLIEEGVFPPLLPTVP